MTAPFAPVDVKNPVIAGVLAFLCPGAGHLYQKRFFKAFVFAACVWGSWWTADCPRRRRNPFLTHRHVGPWEWDYNGDPRAGSIPRPRDSARDLDRRNADTRPRRRNLTQRQIAAAQRRREGQGE